MNIRMNDIIIRTMTIDDYDREATLWAGSRALVSEALMIQRALSDFFAEIPTPVWWRRWMASLWVPFSADMMAVRAICIMFVWMLHTDSMALGVNLAAKAIMKAEQINKVYLIAFTRNEGGNAFWKRSAGMSNDRNYYDLNLNEANMTVFNE